MTEANSSEDRPVSENPSRYGLPEKEYQELRQRYQDAPRDIKREVVNQVANALYDDIHHFVRSKTDDGRFVSPTSLTIVTYMKMLGYFTERDGDLNDYETVGRLMILFQRGVHQAMCDKYRKLALHPKSLSGHSDDEDNSIDVSSNERLQDDIMTREIAQKLLGVLKEEIAPEELDILMMRYADGMTYAEIVQEMEDPKTSDAVRMQLKRLHEAVLRLDRVKKIEKDYRGET